MFTWFLASNSDIHLSDISLPLAIAAVAATALWSLLLLAFAFTTRPRDVEPGQPTMDLGEEPPAVVDYLLHGFRTSGNGVSGTLLDLAARHYLSLEEVGTDTLCSLGREAPTGILPYERMLYDHVASLAANGPVPTLALTTGPAAQSANWMRRFADSVAQDARGRGLVEPRWGLKEWGIQRLVGLVAACLVIATAAQANAFEFGVFASFVVAAFAHTGLQKLFGSQKLTPGGVNAVSHWLGVKAFLAQGEGFHDLPPGHVILWDRYMAYAGALGLARTALQSLPIGAEDDHRAWSNVTGTWRQVVVRYPRARFVWGRTPFNLFFIGVATVALGGAGIYGAIKLHALADGYSSTDDVANLVQQFALAVAGVSGLVVFWGLTTLNLTVVDFGQKRAVQGRVVRCRSFPRGNHDTDYFVAVDDGSRDHVKAWLVDKGTYDLASEGALVSALVSRSQAHVFRLETLQAGPQPILPPVQGEVRDQSAAAAGVQNMGPGKTIDPASILTVEEVSAALGEAAGPASPVVAPSQRVPLRAVRFAALSGQGSVSVMVASGGLAPKMNLVAGRMGKTIQLGGLQAVIRDSTILLMRPDEVIAIRVENTRAADKEDVMRQLGLSASQRLGAASATSSP